MKSPANMTIKEVYNQMDSKDIIKENMPCNFPSAVYVAFGICKEGWTIVAAGSHENCPNVNNHVYYKAVARGFLSPRIEMASKALTPEAIESHNSSLEKALSNKKAV